MNLLRVSKRKKVRVLTMPDGSKVRMIEEKFPEAHVRHTEHWDDHVDATVYPKTLRLPVRTRRFF